MPRRNRLVTAQIHLRALGRIESQARALLPALPPRLIRPMTLETILRKNLANIAVEIDPVRGGRDAPEKKRDPAHQKDAPRQGTTKPKRWVADHANDIPLARGKYKKPRHSVQTIPSRNEFADDI